MKARLTLLAAATGLLLAAAVIVVPATFVPDRLELDHGATLLEGGGVEWIPVWRLGAGESELATTSGPALARGRFELLGLLLLGEICLVLAVAGCGLLAAIRAGPTGAPTPPTA